MHIDTSFTYCPPEHTHVMDPEFVLNACPDITIQDARSYGGGLCVNEWLEDAQASKPHGSFLSLQDAKACALKVAEDRRARA